MRVHFFPLSIAGAADITTGDIFISSKQVHPFGIVDTIIHELAHVICSTRRHNLTWSNCYRSLGGIGPTILNTFDIPLALNIGNISGIQNILTDYHLLQSYRKFSQKILGTEGHWDVVGEGDGGPGDQLIRLYPTPKGAFPVVVVYYPVVNHFRSPQAKHVAYDMLLAEAKCMVGQVRRKIAGIPLPDGGSLGLDGEALVAEGTEERNALIEKAIHLGEPLPIITWTWLLPFLLSLGSLAGAIA